MKCTEPELWATIPEWDAPDDVIERYFDHLDACPYHAELERRGTDAVQLTFDAARSVSDDGALTFSDQEEAAAFDALSRLEAIRESGARVSALTLRVDGKKIGSLDFVNGRKLKKKIGRRQPLQIYGRAGAGEPELLLSTYVPAAQHHPGSYRVRINDQQTLLLDAKPSRGATVQIEISCLTPVLDVERRGLLSIFSGELLTPMRVAFGVFLLVMLGIGVLIYRNQNRQAPLSESPNINAASKAEQAQAVTDTNRQTNNQSLPVNKSGDGNPANRAQIVTGGSNKNRRVRRTSERPTKTNQERAEIATLAASFSGTPEDKTAVHDSLLAGKISFDGSDYQRLNEQTRGAEDKEVSPLYPKKEATLETNPHFRWRGAEGLQYRIIVTYLDSTEVTSSKVLTQDNGRLEEELKPGTYYWQIAKRRKGRKEEIIPVFTIFKVLSAEEKERLEAAVNSTDSHLVRAILYARAAFPEKAEAELQKHPHSPTAKKMLRQLRDLRQRQVGLTP